nr:hypothetical protein Q903MT_gene6432 [Picea sitchensis]
MKCVPLGALSSRIERIHELFWFFPVWIVCFHIFFILSLLLLTLLLYGVVYTSLVLLSITFPDSHLLLGAFTFGDFGFGGSGEQRFCLIDALSVPSSLHAVTRPLCTRSGSTTSNSDSPLPERFYSRYLLTMKAHWNSRAILHGLNSLAQESSASLIIILQDHKVHLGFSGVLTEMTQFHARFYSYPGQ